MNIYTQEVKRKKNNYYEVSKGDDRFFFSLTFNYYYKLIIYSVNFKSSTNSSQ